MRPAPPAHIDTDRCSVLSAALGEPLAGSAPVAAAWLFVEQPGPWGRDAVTTSHLDAEVARTLADTAAAAGVRVQLLRPVGRHPDDHRPDGTHRVVLAHTAVDQVWAAELVVDGAPALLDLDLAGLAAGRPQPGAVPVAGPLAMVCTNGRRDRCCAIEGRTLATALAEAGRPVWETSHLGGHRFSPTMVVLPTGTVHGRLALAGALEVLDAAAAGTVSLTGYRGRPALSRPEQAAEAAVRATLTPAGPGDLDARPAGDDHVVVRHRDGRSWRVGVTAQRARPPRPESCGKEPVSPQVWRATSITPYPGGASGW